MKSNKKKNTTKKLSKLATMFIVSTLSITLLVFPSRVMARSAGLSVSPPVIEIIMKPNKSIVQAFTIKNQAERTQIVPNIAHIMPIGTKGGSTIDLTPLDPSSTPLIVSLENAGIEFGSPFTLGAGESTQLVLRLESASVNETQDVYLALTLSAGADVSSSTPVTTPTISSLILSTISPDENVPIDLEITNFNLPMIHDSGSVLEIGAEVKNNAGVMIRPGGAVRISNWRGHTILEKETFPHLVLGKSSRTIEMWEGDGEEVTESSPLAWDPSLLDLGPHTISITLLSSGGDVLAESSQTVWVLPIQAIIYAGVLAILLIATLGRRESKKEKENGGDKKENS